MVSELMKISMSLRVWKGSREGAFLYNIHILAKILASFFIDR
jgi:hypothetical protein